MAVGGWCDASPSRCLAGILPRISVDIGCAMFFWLLDVIYVLFWPLARPDVEVLNRWLGRLAGIFSSGAGIIHEHMVGPG